MAQSSPPTAGTHLHVSGQDWDVVRVPRSIGLAAVQILGTRCGAVIESQDELALLWFIPAGTAADWTGSNSRVLSPGQPIHVPPARRTTGPGAHWLVCPGEGNWLTDPKALRAALEDALAPRTGGSR